MNESLSKQQKSQQTHYFQKGIAYLMLLEIEYDRLRTMSSMTRNMTRTNRPIRGKALAISSEYESILATEILSITILSILGLVLIIINATLIA